jgi:hypothetical protein
MSCQEVEEKNIAAGSLLAGRLTKAKRNSKYEVLFEFEFDFDFEFFLF